MIHSQSRSCKGYNVFHPSVRQSYLGFQITIWERIQVFFKLTTNVYSWPLKTDQVRIWVDQISYSWVTALDWLKIGHFVWSRNLFNEPILSNENRSKWTQWVPQKPHCSAPKSVEKRFIKDQVEFTRRVASARIHVERKMEQIKNFRILQGILPLSLGGVADSIFLYAVLWQTFFHL